MAGIIHLVRHGRHALLDRTLCGRMPGVTLDDLGCEQMRHCAGSIRPQPTLIQSSPQRRALQSASILADHFGLPVEIAPAIDEIDVGDWTGSDFAELGSDPRWREWNARRGSCCPPRGESMRALQRRIVDHLEQLRTENTGSTVVIVSHAEPIRAALLHYSNRRLDDFLSIEIDPASVSTLSVGHDGIRIAHVNQGGAA